MRNAKPILALALTLSFAGCAKHKQPDQNMTIDEGIPDNQVSMGNADIETLPADESSATPSGQLQNGYDNPDVNEAGSGNSE